MSDRLFIDSVRTASSIEEAMEAEVCAIEDGEEATVCCDEERELVRETLAFVELRKQHHQR